jgi:hypothetical protein
MEGGAKLPSGEVLMSDKLDEQIRVLVEKVDRILSLLESGTSGPRPRTAAPRTPKQKAAPLSSDEIAAYQARFESLSETWTKGEELQVETDLDAMSAEELRRFADANNLNVTSKTPKKKILQLVAGRFRERRQLMRSHFTRQT